MTENTATENLMMILDKPHGFGLFEKGLFVVQNEEFLDAESLFWAAQQCLGNELQEERAYDFCSRLFEFSFLNLVALGSKDGSAEDGEYYSKIKNSDKARADLDLMVQTRDLLRKSIGERARVVSRWSINDHFPVSEIPVFVGYSPKGIYSYQSVPVTEMEALGHPDMMGGELEDKYESLDEAIEQCGGKAIYELQNAPLVLFNSTMGFQLFIEDKHSEIRGIIRARNMVEYPFIDDSPVN